MKIRICFFVVASFLIHDNFLSAQSENQNNWLLDVSASAGVNKFIYSTGNQQLSNTVDIQNKNSLLGVCQSVHFSAYRVMKKHGLGGGIGWNQRKENINANALPDMLEYYNLFKCLDFFVEEQYQYLKMEEHSKYLGIGICGSLLYSAQSDYRALGMNQNIRSDISHGLNSKMASIYLKWGMDWNVHPHWKIGGFVKANYGFSNMSLNSDWKMQPLSIAFGVRLLKF